MKARQTNNRNCEQTNDDHYAHTGAAKVNATMLKTLFTARCTLVQSTVLRSHVICLSVRL